MPEPAPLESWEGDRAERWVRRAAGLERQLAPVSTHLFAAADLSADEVVLDVGCGTGPTTRQAAVAVGPGGRVTGLDVSQEMLDAAAAVGAEPGAAPIEWLQADAVAWSPPDPPPYDAVISRFGVMFFSDPVAAFTNLARATRPGGRLTIAVWAERDASEVFAVALQTVCEVLDRRGVEHEVPAADDGPFSLHDAASVRDLLESAGWGEVETTTHDVELLFGGGQSSRDAAAASLDFGPTRIVMAGVDQEATGAALAELTGVFEDHLDANDEVVLGGRIRIVQARVAGS
jgi:SAM-dependent methyltransferase